jgi:DNA-binding NarL/FixJ family response regulator
MLRAVEALSDLRLAYAAWQELDAPYETARTRVLLAEAYRALDMDAATRECAAARSSFERLGAVADLRALDAGVDAPCGLTAREIEVLGLVAVGQSNREIAANLFISQKTVARHVANIFTKLGVSTRSAATAYAYANHLMTAPQPH